jgi:hypothetical protein
MKTSPDLSAGHLTWWRGDCRAGRFLLVRVVASALALARTWAPRADTVGSRIYTSLGSPHTGTWSQSGSGSRGGQSTVD